MFKLASFFNSFITGKHLQFKLEGDTVGGQPAVPDAAVAAPVEPVFDGSPYQYTFRGAQVVPGSKEEMIEKMQIGHSAQMNKQKFDTDRTDLDGQMAQYKQYADLHTELSKNPALHQGITDLYNQHTQQPAAAAQPTQDPRVDTILAQQADDALNREMGDLQSKFPNHAWDKDTGDGTYRQQILNHMKAKGIMDPVDAYKSFNFDAATKDAQFNGASTASQQQQAAHQNGVVSTGNAAPAAAPAVAPKNYDQAMGAMLNEVGNK